MQDTVAMPMHTLHFSSSRIVTGSGTDSERTCPELDLVMANDTKVKAGTLTCI